MILALRAHTELVGKRKKQKPPPPGEQEDAWPSSALVFDTETTRGQTQMVNFGVYIYCQLEHGEYVPKEKGIFYRDGLPEHFVSTLARAASQIPLCGELPAKPMSRSEFIKKVLLPVALKERGLIVGFNLPFDLSRLAVDSRWAKRSEDGVSFILQWRKNPHSLKLMEDHWTPRIRINPKDGISAFIRFTSGSPRKKNRRTKRVYPGRFADLRALCFALHSKAYSLKTAYEAFRALPKMDYEPTGKISEEEALYCHGDAESTLSLLNKARGEFLKHDIDTKPDRVFSPASIAKAYFKRMGLKPPQEKFRVPPKVLGRTMNAYYGGRSECRIRHTEVPVAMVDFTSEYSTVNVLMGLWEIVRASRLEVASCTEKVRQLLESVTLEQALNPRFWKRLRFFALIEPDGDRLPVRTFYKGESSNIGLNPLHSTEPVWYAAPDLVASKLLTDNAPRILKAFRLIPMGIQKGLRSVRLRGETVVDPRRDDFFKAVIEARKRAMSDCSLDELERKSVDFALKVLGSAGSYGLFVELNPEHASAEGADIRVCVDDPAFARPTKTKIVEKHGRWYFPPLGALVTSAGRLLVAVLECLVRHRGGSHLMCDTDSMAIVASEHGGLVPCVASDGRKAVKALWFRGVEEIVSEFRKLNPYEFLGSILEIKKDSTKRQLYGFAIASKRYALYSKKPDGELLKIEKASGHALGYLQSPDQRPFNEEVEADQWVIEGWEWIIKNVLGIPSKSPRWFNLPAVMPIKITTANVLRPLQSRERRLPYDKRIKPFNFALIASKTFPDGDTPIAPFNKDASKWKSLNWTGARSRRKLHLGPDDLKTLREKIEFHRTSTEDKSLAPDGSRSDENTKGLLSPMRVYVDDILYIGKETDTRYILESETGEGDRLEPEHVVYQPRETRKMAISPETSKRAKGASLTRQKSATRLDKKTIIRARRKKLLRKSTIQALKKGHRQVMRKGSGIRRPRWISREKWSRMSEAERYGYQTLRPR